jgi:hypothetical protein
VAPSARAAYSAELKHILASESFRNAEGLKRLLEFLGQEALGQDRDLKEYTVGVEGLGKPASYDPRVDSSVRVQAGKLRLKLDEYYRTEGANDPVFIHLPKGRFRLEFHPRSQTPRPPGQYAPSARRRREAILWATVAAAVFWAVIATGFALRPKAPVPGVERYGNPAVMALWSPFLLSKRPAIISLGTPLFAKISGDFFRDPVLNHANILESSRTIKQMEQQLGGQAVAAYPYTGIGEASAAFEIAHLFLARGREINLVLSSALTWEDINRNDVVFIGPPKYNLYEWDLPVRQDFTIRHGRLENLHPKPGEPASFRETWSQDQSMLLEGYALIGRLPGLHGTGYMMLLASTSTEGTRAAAEYVTRPEYAAQLARSLSASGRGMPKYFEAVIRAQFRSQTPIQIEQVAVHILR